MAIVKIENGKVVATFRDVKTVAEALVKYPHLAGMELEVGDHPAGTLFASGVFTPPVIPPRPPPPEDLVILALRDMADDLGPAVRAKLEQRLGPRRPV